MSNITPQTLSQLLRAYERATGLHCCFRALDRLWYEPKCSLTGRLGSHVTLFCVPIKSSEMSACMRCDANHLHEEFTHQKQPYVRICHAGADELRIPIHWQNQLVAVVFFGQFRQKKSQPKTLPLWHHAQVRYALNLVQGLQSRLCDIYQHMLVDQPEPADPRLKQIMAWINNHLTTDPTLEELSSYLCISSIWACHLVRQLSGKTFTQLKDDIRIQHAQNLLAGSTLKIAAVAQRLGMQDANYFSRFYKNKTGLTASQYRKMHQININV